MGIKLFDEGQLDICCPCSANRHKVGKLRTSCLREIGFKTLELT